MAISDLIRASRMRPTYHWTVPQPPEQVTALLVDEARADASITVNSARQHLVLGIPNAERHTWSPTLDVHASKEGEGSLVFARLGPHPDVWTLFMALHAANAFVGIMGLMFGLSQWTMGSQPWALVSVPVFFLAGGLLHLASIVGRGLGSDQVHRLLAVAERALGGPSDDATGPVAPAIDDAITSP